MLIISLIDNKTRQTFVMKNDPIRDKELETLLVKLTKLSIIYDKTLDSKDINCWNLAYVIEIKWLRLHLNKLNKTAVFVMF